MKHVIIAAALFSSSAFAASEYVVINNRQAYNEMEVPRQVCFQTQMGPSMGCQTVYDKVQVPAEGYHVVVKDVKTSTQYFFTSKVKYEIGHKFIKD